MKEFRQNFDVLEVNMRKKVKRIFEGKYIIVPYTKKSVYIYREDGEGGEFKISTFEKYIDKLWEEQF